MPKSFFPDPLQITTSAPGKKEFPRLSGQYSNAYIAGFGSANGRLEFSRTRRRCQ